MHALITGASSGIGAAVATELSDAGYDVTLVARRKEKLEEVAARCKNAHVLSWDLSDSSTLGELLAKAENAGPVDVLVNNAGTEHVVDASSIEEDVLKRMLDLNFHTPIALARKVLPGMIERGRGTIVDVCSVAGFAYPPFQTHYAGTKAGLAAYSTALRHELRRTGVHVMTVYPGPIRTELGLRAARGSNAPARLVPWGTPEVLARKIRQGISTRKRNLVYPAFYWIVKALPATSRFMTNLHPTKLTTETS